MNSALSHHPVQNRTCEADGVGNVRVKAWSWFADVRLSGQSFRSDDGGRDDQNRDEPVRLLAVFNLARDCALHLTHWLQDRRTYCEYQLKMPPKELPHIYIADPMGHSAVFSTRRSALANGLETP